MKPGKLVQHSGNDYIHTYHSIYEFNIGLLFIEDIFIKFGR